LFTRAKRDQQVIWGELPDRIGQGLNRIVAADSTTRLAAHHIQLPEDGLEARIGLLTSSIGRRCQPLEPLRQSRRDHKYLLGGIDQPADPERELLRPRGRLARCDQQSRSHPITVLVSLL
jgi:hypothetical protein